jgi:hypothetical protein
MNDLSTRPSAPIAADVPPTGGSLHEAIEALARDAAALREAVARFEIVGRPAEASPPDDGPLLDTLVAAQAREQRARDDTVELTRGLARITTQCALLLVRFTDSAGAFLHRFAAADGARIWPASRGLTLGIGIGVGLAGVAAIVSALALVQARDGARQMDRLQQTLVQTIGDGAAKQDSSVRALEARMRELTSREAAIIAAIQAPPPAAPVAEPEATAPKPVKPATSNRAKRKAAR